jgi:hypothetical protein
MKSVHKLPPHVFSSSARDDSVIILPTALLSLFLQNQTYNQKELIIDLNFFIEIRITSTNVYKHLLKTREICYQIVIFYRLLPIIPFFKDNIDSSILEIYYCYKLISRCYKISAFV